MVVICRFLFIAVFLILPAVSRGQNRTSFGRIIDKDWKFPVSEATVSLKEHTVKSNITGDFQIEANPGDTLEVKHPEYETYRLAVQETLPLTVSLVRRYSKAHELVYSTAEVDERPEPIVGLEEFFRQLGASTAKYPIPKKARKAGIQGKVIIGFIVDELGEVREPGVVLGLGYGYDEIALESFKGINSKWKPGVRKGEKVKVLMQVQINYKLE